MNKQSVLNYLERFHAENAERILRLEVFINSAHLGEGDIERFPVQNAFLELTEQYKERILGGTTEFIFHREEEDDLWSFDHSKNLISDIKHNHKQLKWMVRPWPQKDIKVFLNSIFKDNDIYKRMYKKLNGTVVFVDDYNFRECEVREDFRTSEHQNAPSAPIYALPKAENTNPLSWGFLVHEVGHAIAQNEGLVKQVVSKFFDETSSKPLLTADEKKILEEWSSEIIADLIALRLLGPGYLSALINVVSFTVWKNLRIAYSKSPPPYSRVQFLLEILKKDIDVEKKKLGIMLKEVFDQRNKLDTTGEYNLASTFSGPEGDKHIPGLGSKFSITLPMMEELFDITYKTLKERGCLPLAFDESNYERSEGLAENRLNKEIPPNAYRPEGAYSHDESTGFEDRRASLKEEPAKLSEIFNAGWIIKAYNQRSWMKDALVDDAKTNTDEYFGRYLRELSKFDLFSIKAMECSSIHHFYTKPSS